MILSTCERDNALVSHCSNLYWPRSLESITMSKLRERERARERDKGLTTSQSYTTYCHMGSHKMKVTDSALYTVTRASGVIFLIYPTSCVIFLISLLVGSPIQIMLSMFDSALRAMPLKRYQNSFGYIPHISLAAILHTSAFPRVIWEFGGFTIFAVW